VNLNIFSRYVVGRMIALRETTQLAEQLIVVTVVRTYLPIKILTRMLLVL
jgi:hypothetical protein